MIFGRLARAVNIIAELLPSLERIECFIILENNSLESLEGTTSSPGLFPFHPFKGKALGTRLWKAVQLLASKKALMHN